MAAPRPPVVPLPKYCELPISDQYPASSSWGLWGDDDVLGCLNLIDDAARARGLAAARHGDTFRLDLPLNVPSPPFLGRPPFEHEVTWHDGKVGQDDSLSSFNTQVSTQWDGFRHVRWPPGGFYNGLHPSAHGIDHWAAPGIVTRGVVLDVARFLARRGRHIDHDEPDTITADELADALADAEIEVEPGDVLLIRTGWLSWYRALAPADQARVAQRNRFSGLEPGTGVAELLWDLHVAAVACDNPALEVFPVAEAIPRDEQRRLVTDAATAGDVFLHYSLVALLGMPIGEFWDLDALADSCAGDGAWSCLLVSAPLYLPGGVASPANAIGIR